MATNMQNVASGNGSPGRAKKRVKTNSCPAIDELPETILSTVASYLAVPSRAILSAALTAPSSSWGTSDDDSECQRPSLSTASRAVLSSTSWEILNFADVEEWLAYCLKDDDLRGILVCIDAVNQLKRLKLVNCNNIKGYGLEPLRGSVVLEQMDLSLAEQYSEYTRSNELSVDVVVPILDSILGKEGSAIRHVDFPQKLNRVQDPDGWISLLRRYSRLLASRRSRCFKCNGICIDPVSSESSLSSWIVTLGNQWGYQHYTCCKCTENFCWKPPCRVEACSRCGKHHCNKCTSRCDSCGKSDGCTARCDDIGTSCGRRLCADCVETCQQCDCIGCDDCLNFHRCPSCGDKGYCGNCYEGESVDGNEIYCENCGHVQKSDY